MKLHAVILLTLGCILTSCSPSTYYQVHTVKPLNAIPDLNTLVFADANCTITYDFWGKNGDLDFVLLNNSDTDLVIDLAKCFIVYNGFAYELYRNSTSTNSKSFGNWNYGAALSSGSTNTVSYLEKRYLTIPAKCKIYKESFKLQSDRYTNCEYPDFPTHKKIRKLEFQEGNSPYVFSHIITYEKASLSYRLKNDFFVSEIVNLTTKGAQIKIRKDECGRDYSYYVKEFKDKSPFKYYLEYNKE